MRRCRETPDCWMSTASTSTSTDRSPAPSVSTIRRRVESARTSNTTDSTRDVYTCVYIHFSALLDVRKLLAAPTGLVFGLKTAIHLEHKAHAEFRLHWGPRVTLWSGLSGVRRRQWQVRVWKSDSFAG